MEAPAGPVLAPAIISSSKQTSMTLWWMYLVPGAGDGPEMVGNGRAEDEIVGEFDLRGGGAELERVVDDMLEPVVQDGKSLRIVRREDAVEQTAEAGAADGHVVRMAEDHASQLEARRRLRRVLDVAPRDPRRKAAFDQQPVQLDPSHPIVEKDPGQPGDEPQVAQDDGLGAGEHRRTAEMAQVQAVDDDVPSVLQPEAGGAAADMEPVPPRIGIARVTEDTAVQQAGVGQIVGDRDGRRSDANRDRDRDSQHYRLAAASDRQRSQPGWHTN